MQDDSNRRAHHIEVLLGKVDPVYVITAEGKTWQSKEKPVTTIYGTSFVDSATGETIRISGTAVIEEK